MAQRIIPYDGRFVGKGREHIRVIRSAAADGGRTSGWEAQTCRSVLSLALTSHSSLCSSREKGLSGRLERCRGVEGPRFFLVPARNSGLAVRGPALDGWWAMQGFCLLIETALQGEKGLARAVWSRCRAADGREFQVGGRSGTVLSINNRQCFKYVFFR